MSSRPTWDSSPTMNRSMSGNGLSSIGGGGSSSSGGVPTTVSVDSIRKEIRKYEVDVDTKLSALSSLNDKVQRDTASEYIDDSYIEFDVLTSELDSIFKNLTRCNELLAKEQNISISMIQHHRDKLEDFLKDYKKYKKNITYSLEHSELLSGSTYKNKDTEIPMNNLLREQQSLHNSNYVADSILGQARQAHEALENQRKILRGASHKINNMTGIFGAIDGVTTKIKRMKSRNMMVLGGLIGISYMVSVIKSIGCFLLNGK
ncbi:hypothetical protein PPL_10164 [Heterostelium album PN500]|uniref:Uncharacterized protein n=1 Tax=Heterostelium pallidum (strain ATCC 26659 / Pp 5 / PN500) TaxID=670386 RepID=D3BQH9_HETP5|nr:hypothetical protein PPL_10164 [Heterostelium album PN500]EFA76399.1 hypothetical protein PPL_10164 [Heterostelium album PN500]|eukprot:XP_020428531.1 hypothetical protein PPL_10164 [Heterostelium album PN500]